MAFVVVVLCSWLYILMTIGFCICCLPAVFFPILHKKMCICCQPLRFVYVSYHGHNYMLITIWKLFVNSIDVCIGYLPRVISWQPWVFVWFVSAVICILWLPGSCICYLSCDLYRLTTPPVDTTFKQKKLLLPLNSVSEIFLGCTVLEIRFFCR